MQTIDSLKKVWQIQKDLARLSSDEAELISTLLRWPKLSIEEKLKTYSENTSHEVNMFLKLKDPGFFKDVIRPFLQNKIEKTLVDLWLLDLTADLQTYLQPHSKSLTSNPL